MHKASFTIFSALILIFAQCSAISAEKNPYIHNGTINYHPGDEHHLNTANGAWLGTHFDVIVGMHEPEYDLLRAAIVAANPKVKILGYIQLQQVTRSKTDPLFLRIIEQKDPDAFFFHAATDCIQTIGSTDHVRKAGQNICTDYGDECYPDDRIGSRWLIDNTSPENRSFLCRWVKDIYGSDRKKNIHGFMIDNNSAGGAGTRLKSGRMRRANGFVDAPFNILSWGSGYEAYMNYLMQQLDSELDPAAYLVSNYGNYDLTNCSIWGWPGNPNGCMPSLNGFKFTYPMAKRLAFERGLLTEFRIDFSDTYSTVDRANTPLKEVWQARHKPANAIYFQYYQPTGVPKVIPDSSDRIKLWSLATHLLYQFDGLYFHYHSNDNISPDTDWFDAQDARIGTALDEKTQIDERTFKRTFSNGVVLVRFRTSDKDNYTDSQRYDLGGTYYPVVRADGPGSKIYGDPVTHVTLHNQEGFIGVKAR
jgi:hypothetical protein